MYFSLAEKRNNVKPVCTDLTPFSLFLELLPVEATFVEAFLSDSVRRDRCSIESRSTTPAEIRSDEAADGLQEIRFLKL
jgi:hypothetical protein